MITLCYIFILCWSLSVLSCWDRLCSFCIKKISGKKYKDTQHPWDANSLVGNQHKKKLLNVSPVFTNVLSNDCYSGVSIFIVSVQELLCTYWGSKCFRMQWDDSEGRESISYILLHRHTVTQSSCYIFVHRLIFSDLPKFFLILHLLANICF